MTSTTHTTSSLALGLAPIYFFPDLIELKYMHFYLGGLAIGSLFPDIDEPNSSIGRSVSKYFPFIPYLINIIFGHRGITHRFIFFLVPLVFILAFIKEINTFLPGLHFFGISFCFGMFFHQIGDMLSGSKYYKGGIKNYFSPFGLEEKYFTPFPKIFRCAVGDIKEQIYNILFIAIILFELKEILNISI
ncbi:metal-dependent hydrolase (plasmid) [Aliarcobacter lanthieri]|uniref:metal-dependent hydrolase n=1 Tax=Aliarcobacter lanthieri TaxID=1355374 RepID=UPI003AAA5C14